MFECGLHCLSVCGILVLCFCLSVCGIFDVTHDAAWTLVAVDHRLQIQQLTDVYFVQRLRFVLFVCQSVEWTAIT